MSCRFTNTNYYSVHYYILAHFTYEFLLGRRWRQSEHFSYSNTYNGFGKYDSPSTARMEIQSRNVLTMHLHLQINLCLFIVSVRVVFIKLNCSVLRQRQRHFWKWVKSTLMLVPLFGAHDIFFSVEPWIEDKWIKTYFYNAVRIVCAFQVSVFGNRLIS